MSYDVGLTTAEGVANGFSPTSEQSKRNIGILMHRERGVIGQAIPIADADTDKEVFGNNIEGSYGATMVRNFFRNTQGAKPTVYGARVVGKGSKVATGELNANTYGKIKLKASYQGSEDIGSWGNAVSVVLYNSGIKQAGKFYLEVVYKNKVVERYNNVSLLELFKEISKNSKFVSADMDSVKDIKPNFTDVAKTKEEPILFGEVAGLKDDASFSVANPSDKFATAVAKPGAAIALLTKFGEKIGIVSSFNAETKEGKLTTNALYTGSIKEVTFTDEAYYDVTLSGGVLNKPTEGDFYGRVVDGERKGLEVFAGSDIQVVFNTEFHTLTMALEGSSWGSSNDIIFVGNLLKDANVNDAREWSRTLTSSGVSHLALYHGWGKTSVDPTDGSSETAFDYVPVCAGAIGAGFIKATSMQGDFIHIPPAGLDASLVDYVSIKGSDLKQNEINTFVDELFINVVQYQKGVGNFLISSRMMSSNPLYQSIHIRLQTSFYKRSVYANNLWVLQKPLTPELATELYASLFAYFKTEYDNGALERSIPFAQACNIITDKRVNPASQSRKLLNAVIEYIPTEAAEAVRISLNRNDGQLIINEL